MKKRYTQPADGVKKVMLAAALFWSRISTLPLLDIYQEMHAVKIRFFLSLRPEPSKLYYLSMANFLTPPGTRDIVAGDAASRK
jgi:hypothetical protein